MGKRDYIPAFFKYRETLAGLTDAEVGRVFRAALDYGADGTLPALSPVEGMAFGFIRTDIDAAARAYEERCEANRENARKRWDSDGMRTDANGCENMRTDAKHANTIQYKTIQDNTIQGESTRARTRGSEKQSGKRLTVGGPDAAGAAAGATHRDEPVPPTVDDINAYCREAGLVHVDPRRFFDNYAVSGWMRNGEPIRDWKALCRKWDAEDAEKAAHAAPKPQETSFDTDEFFEAALARSYADYNGEGGWTDES